MFELTDQVVMITGAAGNLGEAAARAFHAAGARLALVDNREDRLANMFGEMAGVFLLPSVDVTDETAVSHMVQATINHYGRVDALINVAGGFRMGPPLHETPLDTWSLMMDLNARSVFLTARAVAPQMIDQGYGRIVNIAARAANEGKAKMGPYIASKSAVIRLTETLSAELKDRGITVNCILPGTIDTPQNRESMPAANFDKWVPPAAIADVILFLCSPFARAVTGAAIPVAGRS